MKKSESFRYSKLFGIRKKWLIAMKTFILLVFAFSIQLNASVHSQQRVSLKMNDVSAKEFIKEIEAQTNLGFIYNLTEIKKLDGLSIDANQHTVEEILDEVLEGTDLTYEIDKSVIIIIPKPEHPKVEIKQEKKELKGAVTDEDGNTLPGVSVVVRGTTTGVATDINGNYSLELESEDAVLVFSFVGMDSQTIEYVGQDILNVILKYNTSSIDEVVVTGYSKISKERAAGSFTKLDSDIIDKPTTDISSRLLGTAVGLQEVVGPDGKKNFQIRGQSALAVTNGGISEPLVVVDGFPIEGGMSNINPNDVESITLLKDASAASIWGARSGNGVIVVTTKRSKKGSDTKVEVNSFVSFGSKRDIVGEMNRLNSKDQIELEKYTFLSMNEFGSPAYVDTPNSGVSGVLSGDFSASQLSMLDYANGDITEDQMNNILNGLSELDNTKQIKDHLLQNPFTQHHNITISGSSDSMSHRLSLMFENSKSDNKGDNRKEYSLSYSTDYNINKRLTFSVNTNINYNKDDYSGSGSRIMRVSSPLEDAIGKAPYQMLINEDGSLNRWANGPASWNEGSYGINRSVFNKLIGNNSSVRQLFPYNDWTYNPIEEINSREFNSESLQARFQAGINLKLIEGLDFDSKIQYEILRGKTTEQFYDSSYEVRGRVNQTSTWDVDNNTVIANLPKGNFLDRAEEEVDSYNIRNQLNYMFSNEKHEFSALVGSEFSKRTQKIWAHPRSYGYDSDRNVSKPLPNGNGSGGGNSLIEAFPDMWGDPQMVYTNSPDITNSSVGNSYNGIRTVAIPGYSNIIYFSLYGNMSYTYNNKYTVTASVRTDASNFIADDPKYRYAPFWSVGGNWQIKEEGFLSDVNWLNRLTLRGSYGSNGIANQSTSAITLLNIDNIPDQNSGQLSGFIGTPGNPNLRWEKVKTVNLGIDFSVFNHALYGTLEVYNKASQDLVSSLIMPGQQGLVSADINSVEMYNRGIEVELGTELSITKDIIWNANINFSYNKNKITKLQQEPLNLVGYGRGYLEGYGANSLWAFKYAEMGETEPMIYTKDGEKEMTSATFGAPVKKHAFYQGQSVAPYLIGFNTNLKIHNFDFGVIVSGKFGHKFRRENWSYFLPTENVSVKKSYLDIRNADASNVIPFSTNKIYQDVYSLTVSDYMSYLVTNASAIRLQEINMSYKLPETFISKLKISDLKVFAQASNLGVMLFNKYKEDPLYGYAKPPKTYTIGLKCIF